MLTSVSFILAGFAATLFISAVTGHPFSSNEDAETAQKVGSLYFLGGAVAFGIPGIALWNEGLDRIAEAERMRSMPPQGSNRQLVFSYRWHF